MRRLFKILGYLALLLVLLVAGFLVYFFLAFPKTEAAPAVQIQPTPELLARGKYLAENVTGCIACHSSRHIEYYSHPVIQGTEGKGGLFLQDAELGKLYAPNITPHALKDWSDGEIIRAMISGVSRDGRPLFAIMPYNEFAHLSRQDVEAIVAYIRSLPPIPNDVPPTELQFPLSMIVRTMPQPRKIGEATIANRGEYLTTISSCKTCHTPMDRGKFVEGMDFAGGNDFQGVKSANITPDNETGIGRWTRSDFIQAFKRFAVPEAKTIQLAAGTPNTPMPWTLFAHMTEEDLSAIYDYLRTVKPVSNKVERFPAARDRKIDGKR